MRNRLRGKPAAALLLVVFGLVKLPLENALEGRLREAHFRDTELGLTMRDELGQAAFVASLGGFRSLIASGYYIKAHTAFENTEWGKVERDYKVITQLQPRTEHYWDMAHWHMAFNAYAYYARKAEESRSDWDRWRIRNETLPYYLARSRKFLEDGIRYLPDEPKLYRLMGDLMARKYNDHCGAADWYLEGSKKPGARSLMYRLYLYAVSQCDGREEEAYAALLEAHRKGAETPSVILNLEELEDEFADKALANADPAALQKAALENGEGGHFNLAVLGRYYERMANDPRKAAAIYEQLAKSPDAPMFYQKKWGLELAKIPGSERQALEVLRRFLNGRLAGVYNKAERAVRRIESGNASADPSE